MKRPSTELLHRYFDSRCSEQEAELVVNWLATKQGQEFYGRYLEQQMDKELKPHVLGLQPRPEQALRKTYARINRRESGKKQMYWSTAAALALLLLSVWLFHRLNNPSQIVGTAYGERNKIVLDDGTQIMLNANSELRYDKDRPREVWLEGEGYFNVSSTQTSSLFQVHTSDLTVNVLGTVFNVQARHEKTNVILSEGKVTLDFDQHQLKPSLKMVPGDKVSFSQKTKALERSSVNPQIYTAWTKGSILFDHTPLKEIIRLLEDQYGVSVQVKDPELLNKELSGQVELKLPIVLTLLEKSFDINIRRENNTIIME